MLEWTHDSKEEVEAEELVEEAGGEEDLGTESTS